MLWELGERKTGLERGGSTGHRSINVQHLLTNNQFNTVAASDSMKFLVASALLVGVSLADPGHHGYHGHGHHGKGYRTYGYRGYGYGKRDADATAVAEADAEAGHHGHLHLDGHQ